MARKKRTSSAVEHPLAPTIMTELGALKAAPQPAGDFAPGGNWTGRFRIWTCYGHRDSGNHDAGELHIDRKLDGGAQRLAVRQTLRNSQGKLHTIRAAVSCGLDALASPTAWTLRSEFSGSHVDGLPPLAVEQAGCIRGNTWQITAGGRKTECRAPLPLTADWCLFEAVQRMDFRAAAPVKFHVLEGLSVLKEDHRLSYRGKIPVTWGPEKLELHCFSQVGRGVYPYEYWLDDRHRLLLVTTGPRTYILETGAAGPAARGGTAR
ncbi:MAG: hypothetical protein WBF17_06260 [Phycisphaerae bacterium]